MVKKGRRDTRTKKELILAYFDNPESAVLMTDDELGVARDAITESIRKNVGRAVIGLSGGIDSALVAYLAVESIGPKNVYGVMLPSDSNTAEDLDLAKTVAHRLGMEYEVVDIMPAVKGFLETNKGISASDKTAYGNVKARTRMVHLYGRANSHGELVLGTGNKTEIDIGYFTKHGDGGVDLEPIGDLYKTQVWQLSRKLNIPDRIVDRVPSAGLWDGQTDEGEIGMKYLELDKALLGIELGFRKRQITELTHIPHAQINNVLSRIDGSAHKREMPHTTRARFYE